jgi:hypothetical protein
VCVPPARGLYIYSYCTVLCRAVLCSPFLLMHDFGEPSKDLNTLSTAEDPGPPTKRVEKIVGWHPHRGFDIITCVSLSLSLCVCVFVRRSGSQLYCCCCRCGCCLLRLVVLLECWRPQNTSAGAPSPRLLLYNISCCIIRYYGMPPRLYIICCACAGT